MCIKHVTAATVTVSALKASVIINEHVSRPVNENKQAGPT